ncbi:MAG: hypothetical protein ACREI8_11895, partial [Myxococcota bacterium]
GYIVLFGGPTLAQSPCPDQAYPEGESLDFVRVVRQQAPDPDCVLEDGTFVQRDTQLYVHAAAQAHGRCEDWFPQGQQCVIAGTQQRNLYKINLFKTAGPGFSWSTYVWYKQNNCTSSCIGCSHTIDSYSCSTGPRLYVPRASGLHEISANAGIQPTPCQIQPTITPTKMTWFSARHALHKGEDDDPDQPAEDPEGNPIDVGSLEGGGEWENNGPGYQHYHGADPVGDTWASNDWAHEFIQEVGLLWEAAYPSGPNIEFGDISLEGGGAWVGPNGHPGGSHQNGRSIDFRYPIYTPLGGTPTQGGFDFPDAGYTPAVKAYLIELFNVMADTGMVKKIILSDESGITDTDVPGVEIVERPDHKDHFHVVLDDPDGSDENNC